MPDTNNKIEGTFTDLKKNLNNHSGLTQENRKRFISGFSLALESKLEQTKKIRLKKKQATHRVKPVPFNLEFTVLFLMELLPSRAPLCFRLRGKGTNFNTY